MNSTKEVQTISLWRQIQKEEVERGGGAWPCAERIALRIFEEGKKSGAMEIATEIATWIDPQGDIISVAEAATRARWRDNIKARYVVTRERVLECALSEIAGKEMTAQDAAAIARRALGLDSSV